MSESMDVRTPRADWIRGMSVMNRSSVATVVDGCNKDWNFKVLSTRTGSFLFRAIKSLVVVGGRTIVLFNIFLPSFFCTDCLAREYRLGFFTSICVNANLLKMSGLSIMTEFSQSKLSSYLLSKGSTFFTTSSFVRSENYCLDERCKDLSDTYRGVDLCCNLTKPML